MVVRVVAVDIPAEEAVVSAALAAVDAVELEAPGALVAVRVVLAALVPEEARAEPAVLAAAKVDPAARLALREAVAAAMEPFP